MDPGTKSARKLVTYATRCTMKWNGSAHMATAILKYFVALMTTAFLGNNKLAQC